MNSGKSTALIQVAHNYREQGLRVLILKPSIDTKNTAVESRLGIECTIDYDVHPDDDIISILRSELSENPPHCILVDEAQFLSPSQVDQLFYIVNLAQVPVIAYGLRTDFKGSVFPGAARLLGLAHTIEELKNVCVCGRKAILNARKINDEYVTQGERIQIDEKDNKKLSYEGLCGTCYIEKVLNRSTL
jgi:thymidine kinase